MTEYCFVKILEGKAQPLLVMFEMGEFRKPTAILDVFDVIRAVRVYGPTSFLRELKKFDAKVKEAKAA